jgi:molybdate transport system substrate-binding protein
MVSSPEASTKVEIKVVSTLALMNAMHELVSRHEQLTGTIVTTDFAPTNALLNRIRSGEAADVAILTAEAIDQLIGEGVLAPGSRVDLALLAVGIAARAGASRLEIGSIDALKSALLKAESIAYSKIGASGVFFADLIQRLGIAEEVNAKARIIPSGFTAELVASGAAELAVQQVSELMVVPGIEVVARLPSDVQSVTTFSAGLFTGSAHREAAMRVVEILSSRESAPILRASGLDPVARDRAS